LAACTFPDEGVTGVVDICIYAILAILISALEVLDGVGTIFATLIYAKRQV
jgi:hypothetical protein